MTGDRNHHVKECRETDSDGDTTLSDLHDRRLAMLNPRSSAVIARSVGQKYVLSFLENDPLIYVGADSIDVR